MKSYIVKLSNSVDIQIEEEELDKVIQSIKQKIPVKVKQGIFNPSFFVAVVADKTRIEEFYSLQTINEDREKRGMPKLAEFSQLKDIFSDYKKLK